MKIVSCIAVAALIIAAVAADGYCQNMGRKAFRGIANVALSPFEIPKTVVNTFYKELGACDSIFLGIPNGIANMVKRCAIGVYETATFPFPFPEGYMPIMEPEFMWDPST